MPSFKKSSSSARRSSAKKSSSATTKLSMRVKSPIRYTLRSPSRKTTGSRKKNQAEHALPINGILRHYLGKRQGNQNMVRNVQRILYKYPVASPKMASPKAMSPKAMSPKAMSPKMALPKAMSPKAMMKKYFSIKP